jgi:hypothetical protein
LWKCEINVGEYNTLDLVKDNKNKKREREWPQCIIPV